jgi:hypothetical protein
MAAILMLGGIPEKMTKWSLAPGAVGLGRDDRLLRRVR